MNDRTPSAMDAPSLAHRADEIEARLVAIEAAAVTAVGGIGFGKRVGEGTNIAVERFSEVAIHDGLQHELATIRRAEAKLRDGDGGRCDSCGSVIPEERLEAIPWAVHCVHCAT